MIIRNADPRDVAKLYALEKELFSQENFPLSRGSLAYHVRNNLLYVADIDGNIAGYVLVLIKRTNAKLYSLGVAEAYRGKKVAERLMETAFKKLLSLGFKRAVLEVRIDNAAAIALYKRAGFNVIKILKAFYRDGCDAYLMELNYAGETL